MKQAMGYNLEQIFLTPCIFPGNGHIKINGLLKNEYIIEDGR